MIDDFTPPKVSRSKPKRIEPLKKPVRKPLHELAAAEDPSFQTPEQVAKQEARAIDETTVVRHADTKRFWQKLPWPLTRKQQIIAAAILVVLLGGAVTSWALLHHPHDTPTARAAKKAVAKPAPIIYSTLTGLPVADASVNKRPVTGVMIENSIDARPQSGLSQAGVVFEAVAEGGVTRFLALFQDQQPTDVGPIRSARPYYIQWDMGFDAPYAHVGGSEAALADIVTWGVRDLNQFSNGNYYHRISSRDAPHNVYTGIDTLNQLENAKGYTSSNYSGFVRKKDAPYKAAAATTTKGKPATPADTRTPVSSIDLSLSGPVYDPHFDYTPSTNSYNRSEYGAPHVDANSGAQLSPKVVIAMVVPETQGALDSSGAYYSDYNVIGSGQVYVFQDGVVTTGQWSKADNAGQIMFTDDSGQPLKLNPGQTWITAVTSSGKVSYK